MRHVVQSYWFLLPALLMWFVIVHRRRATGRIWWSREQFVARTAFVVYLAAIVNVTMFPLEVRTGDAKRFVHFAHDVTIVPFRDFEAADFTLNVIMLMPLGFALGVFWPRLARIPVAMAIGYGVGAAIELLQLLGRIVLANDRDVTINDVIANTLGVIAGAIVWHLATRMDSLRHQIEWLRDVD